MTALCKCGKVKTIQPFDNSKTVNWLCEQCKQTVRIEQNTVRPPQLLLLLKAK